ncbi:MAG: DUF2520 domain-containing protein [Phaeodactylibacter sp.]|nr:DUF2520 domain-containing protein [Phaeodactylibacter sp.]MCB9264187.1 DUF2520 domain-containing protein [Lewinellaceae bacterium]MCB9290637.1 DUF2520 domain-containing protein [Lewinellaceae bacterium]
MGYPTSITLIGAGNVGYHLGRRLKATGIGVAQVFSRQGSKARELAEAVGAQPVTRLEEVRPAVGLYILAVSDDAIAEVAKKLVPVLAGDSAVVHTSGATPSAVLAPFFPKHGILYPLQTFSREREPDFQSIPICIYSPDAGLEEQLSALGRRISPNVHRIDDEQRATLHVAAVFVNNFTNHLFHIGQEILRKEQLPFELLLPLIQETVNKLEGHTPQAMQTGPARRGDGETIARHLAYLKKFPNFGEVYELLTKNILQLYK